MSGWMLLSALRDNVDNVGLHMKRKLFVSQAEETMNDSFQMFMPRISIAAFIYLVVHLGIALIVKTPSLCIGAVMSHKVRSMLKKPDVKAWAMPDNIDDTDVRSLTPAPPKYVQDKRTLYNRKCAWCILMQASIECDHAGLRRTVATAEWVGYQEGQEHGGPYGLPVH